MKGKKWGLDKSQSIPYNYDTTKRRYAMKVLSEIAKILVAIPLTITTIIGLVIGVISLIFMVVGTAIVYLGAIPLKALGIMDILSDEKQDENKSKE